MCIKKKNYFAGEIVSNIEQFNYWEIIYLRWQDCNYIYYTVLEECCDLKYMILWHYNYKTTKTIIVIKK